MRIDENALLHWVNHFYGYGSWNADIWFIALEESGGDLPEEVAQRFNYFFSVHSSATTPTLCDIRELYKRVSFRINGPRADVFKTLYDYRFTENAVLHGIWKNLIAFAHGYKEEALPDLLTYQQKTFASVTACNEALIRLYPLPSPHNHAWYYSWLDLPNVDFLRSSATYQEHLYKHRMQTILHQIKVHKPHLVLMYGMEHVNTLKQSVQDFFTKASFSLVKAVKQQIPQHHYADLDGTQLLITTQIPALRHNRIETGFEWEAFGAMVKDYQTIKNSHEMSLGRKQTQRDD